ncbi:cell division protein FtsL [Algicella marina]|uniref:Cell division protein FtsL n=1 Tax=Algicella marina TaxID=2683284 RepID=A0A6P1SX32_9RHOB|nr:cell division protein FtsL [Algicella marina]QHQ34041.1 cell division protein FtsL [Algicella marina]
MKTLGTIAAVALVVAFAFWAYGVNYATQDAERRVAALRQSIAEEKAAIAMLRAEWAYLNRPDRLRELAEEHFGELGLMPLDAAHFSEAELLPYPPDEDLPLISPEVQALLAQAEVEG